MKLNIKRFASSGDEEIFVDYSYDYTPNGYIRTVTAIITCDYNISSIFLVQDENEIDDTKNWIITEDSHGKSCAKHYFHETFSAAYNIYCENNETPFSINVDIINDFLFTASFTVNSATVYKSLILFTYLFYKYFMKCRS